MSELNLLAQDNKLFDDGSTNELTENQLSNLKDLNSTEDALLLDFSNEEVLSVKAELGSRYLVKEIRLYTSSFTSFGTQASFSEDDVTYTDCAGVLLSDHIKFTVDAPVKYVKVIQDSSLLSNFTPKITKINSSSLDSFGSTLVGSSTINDIQYLYNSNTTQRFNSTKSWFLEAAQVNVRGKKREFPVHSLLVCTSSSFDIIDLETLELWMRFNVGSSKMLGSVQPTKAFGLDKRIYISLDNAGLVVLDFENDKAFKYDTLGDYQTSSTIASRNSTVSFSERNQTIYINNILSNQIYDVHATYDSDGIFELAAVATASGVSLVVENSAIYNCSDGTKPAKNVKLTKRRNLYWSGTTGTSGEVNYKIDITSVTSGTGISTTFSRDGYYNSSTPIALIGENIKDISLV